MRARTLLLAAALTAQGSGATPVHAGAIPELVAAVGGTLAVQGASGRGGPSISLTAQWPLADHFQFGLTGFLDDIGDRKGQLRDPNDGSPLGPISVLHQSARGALWRIEAQAPRRGHYDAFATATWGVYQVNDDLRGTHIGRSHVPGAGIGIGLKRDVGATSLISFFRS